MPRQGVVAGACKILTCLPRRKAAGYLQDVDKRTKGATSGVGAKNTREKHPRKKRPHVWRRVEAGEAVHRSFGANLISRPNWNASM
jgi:hypothetical protein